MYFKKDPTPSEQDILFRQSYAVLLNLGNAYYALSQNGSALKNHVAMLELAAKVDEKSAIEGKSAALGNIGLIYRAKGDLDEALKYLKEALEIHRDIGYRQGEASQLGNIGLIHSDKGDLDEFITISPIHRGFNIFSFPAALENNFAR